MSAFLHTALAVAPRCYSSPSIQIVAMFNVVVDVIGAIILLRVI